jgi:hypothetical protein
MVKHTFRAAIAALVALLHAATVRAQHPFDSSAWDIHAAESRVEPYRGRSALFLRDGAAWLKGSRFLNGIIAFDVVFSNVAGFSGIAFRAATHSDFELFLPAADAQRRTARHAVYARAPRSLRVANLRRPSVGRRRALDL